MPSSEQGGAVSDAYWQEVCHARGETHHTESLCRSNVEKLRKDGSLCHDFAPEKGEDTGRDGVQVHRRTVHLGGPSSEVLWCETSEEDTLLEDNVGYVGTRESNRLCHGIDPSSKKRTFTPSLFRVCEEAR